MLFFSDAHTFQPTPMQYRVLEWVDLNERGTVIYPKTLLRQTLRTLIERRLVMLSASQLPKYRLTRSGRAIYSQCSRPARWPRWIDSPATVPAGRDD